MIKHIILIANSTVMLRDKLYSMWTVYSHFMIDGYCVLVCPVKNKKIFLSLDN